MKHTIIQKTKYDYGVNTKIELENGSRFLISSMRMLDGTTSYNIYKGDDFGDLIEEDNYEGYYQIIKNLKANGKPWSAGRYED